MKPVYYEKVKVQIVEMSHEADTSHDHDIHHRYRDEEVTHFERMPSINDLLDFMAGMDLKDQIYMTCNLLTVAGYTQREIALALGVHPQTYRNRLMEIRGEFKQRGIRP